MADPYDPTVDLMRRKLREKALANIAAEAQSQDALIDGLSPAVGGYMAKKYAPELVQPVQHGPEFNPEGEGMPGFAAAQERAKDTAQTQAAEEYAAKGNLVAGLGRAGSKIASAISGRQADTSAWDRIGQSAEANRAAVLDYMRKKALGKQEHGLDLEKLGLQQKGAKELAAQNSAADLDRTKYTQGEEMRRLQLQLALEREKFGATKDAKKAENAAKSEEDLRKELMGNQVTKDAQQTAIAYKKVQSALGANSAAGDMAGIFAFMKILDPGSSVREGEYANAQNAGGVPERIIALYNKAVDGRLLDKTQRDDFLNQSKQLLEANSSQYRQLADQYGGLAKGAGVDPSRVVLDLGLGSQQAGPAQVKSAADYNALPPGAEYTAPDGTVRRKK